MEKISIDKRIYDLFENHIKQLDKKLKMIDDLKIGDRIGIIAGHGLTDYLTIKSFLDCRGSITAKSSILRRVETYNLLKENWCKY